MTREQEREQAARDYHLNFPDCTFWQYVAFINGAEWADNSMLKKACEWLEKKACLYVWENCEQGEHGIHKTMLEDFRKAMKGDLDMIDEKKIDKDLMRLVDAEMNTPLGKLLNRNAVYVLGEEIKMALIDKVCKWLGENFRVSSFDDTKIVTHFSNMYDLEDDFRKAMK